MKLVSNMKKTTLRKSYIVFTSSLFIVVKVWTMKITVLDVTLMGPNCFSYPSSCTGFTHMALVFAVYLCFDQWGIRKDGTNKKFSKPNIGVFSLETFCNHVKNLWLTYIMGRLRGERERLADIHHPDLDMWGNLNPSIHSWDTSVL